MCRRCSMEESRCYWSVHLTSLPVAFGDPRRWRPLDLTPRAPRIASMRLLPLSLGIAFAASVFAEEKPFAIQIVDAATGRGVPLVELEAMDNQLYLTDSAGRVAFHEPGQMNIPVWFSLRSHGTNF